MEMTNAQRPLEVHDADLADSRFSKVRLMYAGFDDVNLADSHFSNVKLTNARFDDVNLADSRFSNVRLANASFDDVALQTANFTDANLGGARFRDVDMRDVTIEDANLSGMTINGIAVTDLLRAFENRARIVLYAKDPARLQAFYQGVFAFELDRAESDHVVLVAPTQEVIIVAIPDALAATIEIGEPPRRRSETPIKPVFEVESIAAAREAAIRLHGVVDPGECEWDFRSQRVCDGHDPEGNVLQCRQRIRRTMAE